MVRACLALVLMVSRALSQVSPERLQAIWDEAKTPFKYGIVVEPPAGKKVDCPAVFRYGSNWYMVYILLENAPEEGYTTQIAESPDLLHWKPLGTILDRAGAGAWDHANAGGGLALFDTKWNGTNELQTYEGRYWLSYLGGKEYGYERVPLWIGLASTDDPSKVRPWRKLPSPAEDGGPGCPNRTRDHHALQELHFPRRYPKSRSALHHVL